MLAGVVAAVACAPPPPSPTATPKPVGSAPAVVSGPAASPTPTLIVNVPPQPKADLFANPSEPAYDPARGFSPDAQRVIDLAILQVAIEQFRQARGAYPPALGDLFPTYAPRDAENRPLAVPPTDPVTRQPYRYVLSSDGSRYELSATMSSGKPYAVASN